MNAQIDRRRQILDAAKAVFLERGYASATIADIRQLSGASTGSLYHFFPGKAAIAAALFAEAVAGAEATRRARSGEGAQAEIRALVEGLIDWGLDRPDQFRVLDELRHITPLIQESPEMKAQLDRDQAEAGAVHARGVAAGDLRPLPWPVARALTLGPAYDFLRAYASGRPGVSLGLARGLISDAAWAAVKAG